MTQDALSMDSICVRSLNVGANCVSSNVFEYYQDLRHPAYQPFMMKTAHLLLHPTPKFNVTLKHLMGSNVETLWKLLEEDFSIVEIHQLQTCWEARFAQQTVSQFLLDKIVSAQRLTSFPDRFTSKCDQRYRPAVTTADAHQFDTIDQWFFQWCEYMFAGDSRPVDKIKPILSSKYPAFTADLNPINRPLQILCLALFDACMLHLVQSTGEPWFALKTALLAIQKQRQEALLALILSSPTVHGWCLQECSAEFLEALKQRQTALGDRYMIVAPQATTQFSAILLNRQWVHSIKNFEPSTPVSGLVAAEIVAMDGNQFIIASGHADSDGHSTAQMMEALREKVPALTTVIVGIDANVFSTTKAKPTQLSWSRFQTLCREGGWVNTWECHGAFCDTNYTTHNARTFVQPQFHKAVAPAQIQTHGNQHPKDHFLLFGDTEWNTSTKKFNCHKKGRLSWHSLAVFPNEHYPCDHALVQLELHR